MAGMRMSLNYGIVFVVLAGLLAGCQTTRTFTIVSRPPGAAVAIDGVDAGTTPLTQKMQFKGSSDERQLVVSKRGYQDQTVAVNAQSSSDTLVVDLKLPTRRFTFSIAPESAVLSIDGQIVTPAPVRSFSTELSFALNDKGEWSTHTLVARRQGYEPLSRVIHYEEPESSIALSLESMRKDLSIITAPAGAVVQLDGQEVGQSPVNLSNVVFAVDPETGDYLAHHIKVSLPGYDPVETSISWDNGQTDYAIELKPKQKTVTFEVNPAGATVVIDGQKLKVNEKGESVVALSFAPVDARGTLKTYVASVSKKTADSEWTPQEVTVGWDGGQLSYKVTLKEIITRPVGLVVAQPMRGDDGWQVLPQELVTVAMKDVTEGPQKQSPIQLTQLPAGTMIDSMTVSPDGSKILFVQLLNNSVSSFRSQLVTVPTDGKGGTTMLTDGKSLDLTPSYTPDGSSVVFSSNRAGRRPSVWQMDANGAPGVTQLTSGDTTDLWPSIDSDPKPRLFYQAMVDTRPDPRLYMTQLGTTIRTDLIQGGGQQPRVNPKGDAILFVGVNQKTGKRDIYRMSDKGGMVENLTNTPDADESDPVWNRDGTKIAFVSDRGINEEGMNNKDIWVIDLTSPERPVQITSNGSWDDSPVWDPTGSYIYFRSNRGGSWQIWRIAAK